MFLARLVHIALTGLVTAYHHIVASRCLTLAGFTILVYDHSTTFHEEIAQVWSRRKSLVSLMFLVNRYMTPLVLALDLYDKTGLASPLTHSFCSVWLFLEGYLTILSFSIIHGLVAMRVCALYEQKRWVVTLLAIAFIVYLSLTMTLSTVELLSQARTIQPTPPFNVCYAPISPGLWAVWLPSLIFESLIFVLTIVRVVRYIGHDVSMPVAYLMYRDGIFYFIVMGTNSLLCLLDWLVAPPTLNALAKYFGYALCVCASSKLILNLRALSPRNDVWTMTYESPEAMELNFPGASVSTGTSVSAPWPAVSNAPRTGTPRFATGNPVSHFDIYQRLCTDVHAPPSVQLTEDGIPMAELDVHAPYHPEWPKPI